MSLLEYYKQKNESAHYHLGHMFMDCVTQKPPDGIFQIDAATGEKETNASVWQRSTRLARAIRRRGLKPGAPLVIAGPNHLDVHIPYYAALLNGLPIVGVDPYFKYDEIRNLFKLTLPKIVFCSADMVETYQRVCDDLAIDPTIITFDGEYSMAKFVEEYDDREDIDKFMPANFDTDSVYAWLVSTSGTSGMPKVAAFKHKVVINQIVNLSRIPQGPDDKPKLGLNLAPVQWISGYYNAIGMPLSNLIKLQTSNADDLGHLIHIINEYKPASMMSSPSLMTLLLKHDKPCDLSCLYLLCITGAKAPANLFQTLKSRLGPNAVIMDAYGQTETLGPVLSPNPNGPPGCCGVPQGNRELKLVDPETNEEITEPNVPGELWSRGGPTFSVNPNELEEVISQLSDVLEVCVVGIPDTVAGHVPAACVVLRPQADLTAREIKDHVADKLAPSKHLRGGVIFMDELPKTSTAKIARAKITKLAQTLNRE